MNADPNAKLRRLREWASSFQRHHSGLPLLVIIDEIDRLLAEPEPAEPEPERHECCVCARSNREGVSIYHLMTTGFHGFLCGLCYDREEWKRHLGDHCGYCVKSRRETLEDEIARLYGHEVRA